MRIKIDENLSVDVMELFRSVGHDVESVFSENIQGCSDQMLMTKCREEGRALVTLDNDFSDIITYPPDTTEGIIVLRSKEQGKDAVLKVVRNLLPRLTGNFFPGQLWIVEEKRIRVRGKE
ncbi:DUF5615 family PIN-like protein [Pelotomaculum isophthalicicum JI]|uniref:DUF5615 family PIN-like protein n=1 Tax=Pelotomaculum isophthalicicum JI TaxID=947010 RepID=A0A9X4H194_9FIRM|nr:DUF5615 family PIN-like protein [Pelotomaculum isophthalicicum]MDF9407890.1 DUF5615 family PIN-like protein [Pelotomaculum isophthalicicum JI]